MENCLKCIAIGFIINFQLMFSEQDLLFILPISLWGILYYSKILKKIHLVSFSFYSTINNIFCCIVYLISS